MTHAWSARPGMLHGDITEEREPQRCERCKTLRMRDATPMRRWCYLVRLCDETMAPTYDEPPCPPSAFVRS